MSHFNIKIAIKQGFILPENFSKLSFKDKKYIVRSIIDEYNRSNEAVKIFLNN